MLLELFFSFSEGNSIVFKQQNQKKDTFLQKYFYGSIALVAEVLIFEV